MLSKNVDLNNTVILVTGAAGFVGANLVMSLLSEAEGTQIIGIDSDVYKRQRQSSLPVDYILKKTCL